MSFVDVHLMNPDGLSRESWRLRVDMRAGGSLDGLIIRVEKWANERRETKRHGWKISGKPYDFMYRGHYDKLREPPALHEAVYSALAEQLHVVVDQSIAELRKRPQPHEAAT